MGGLITKHWAYYQTLGLLPDKYNMLFYTYSTSYYAWLGDVLLSPDRNTHFTERN